MQNHRNAIEKSLSFEGGGIWGSLGGHLGVTLGSFWDHSGINLGSFWNDFGMILGWFWDHFGTFCFSGGEDASLYFFAYIICIQSPIKKNKIAPAGNRVGGETPTRPPTDAALIARYYRCIGDVVEG